MLKESFTFYQASFPRKVYILHKKPLSLSSPVFFPASQSVLRFHLDKYTQAQAEEKQQLAFMGLTMISQHHCFHVPVVLKMNPCN